MIDRAKLRQLAQAATPGYEVCDDTAFLDAATPSAVLELLDALDDVTKDLRLVQANFEATNDKLAAAERERDEARRAMRLMAEHDSDGYEYAHVIILKNKLAAAVAALDDVIWFVNLPDGYMSQAAAEDHIREIGDIARKALASLGGDR